MIWMTWATASNNGVTKAMAGFMATSKLFSAAITSGGNILTRSWVCGKEAESLEAASVTGARAFIAGDNAESAAVVSGFNCCDTDWMI